ncbi:hypothetical protein FB567DRAFT_619240 [Paraphoma chrysanthemicola]|uniref:USP domain-containing protein n=1 Tax=Paraphoma chrysanthemicola TaxID=798071 RepID=A0A8K0W0S0_9PLEO|nr:hypothetical protein FB567DRAFT_619240 [Paraphoma chrysanthemicola]
MVEEYWDECPTETPIEAAHNDAGSIAWQAFESGMFQPLAQEDARLFYTWILDQFFENAQEPRANSWQAEHKSLFQIDLQATDTCTTCNHPTNRAIQHENILNLGMLDSHKNIYDAVMDTMDQFVEDVYCAKCERNQIMIRSTSIAAAPKILSVWFNILLPGQKTTHALAYPEYLDLTAWQTGAESEDTAQPVPLRYRLNAVISHIGDDEAGHYIATVRGRGKGTFLAISDEDGEMFSRDEFLANPQVPFLIWNCGEGGEGFQVYGLMYERVDEEEEVEEAEEEEEMVASEAQETVGAADEEPMTNSGEEVMPEEDEITSDEKENAPAVAEMTPVDGEMSSSEETTISSDEILSSDDEDTILIEEVITAHEEGEENWEGEAVIVSVEEQEEW